jgi:rhodanese-related sulfurtransferase
MKKRKLCYQIVLIVVLSFALGLVLNFSLVRKHLRGEFERGFISEEEYPNITFITLAEAEDLFLQGAAVFIDSRTVEKFRSGRILGAVNIPFEGELDTNSIDSLSYPEEQILVIYCDGSDCQSSVQLAKDLHERGFLSLKVFFGGWEEWLREGLPIEDDSE